MFDEVFMTFSCIDPVRSPATEIRLGHSQNGKFFFFRDCIPDSGKTFTIDTVAALRELVLGRGVCSRNGLGRLALMKVNLGHRRGPSVAGVAYRWHGGHRP